MCHLPESRVTASSPFYKFGVDYAGPFIIKDRKGRGSKVSKYYISVFICFSTNGVNLQICILITKGRF